MDNMKQNICELVNKTSNLKNEIELIELIEFIFKTPSETECYFLEKCDFKNYSSKNLISNINELCKTSVSYRVKDNIKVENIVEKYSHSVGEDTKISFNIGLITKSIVSYLIDNNISYKIVNFKSKYSVLMYLLLKDFIRDENKLRMKDISILNLRIQFECVNKYERFSQFKAKVLDIALSDLNKYILNDEEILEYAYIKSGTTIETIRFMIKEKDGLN